MSSRNRFSLDNLNEKMEKGTLPIQNDLFEKPISKKRVVNTENDDMTTLDLWIPGMKNKAFEILDPIPKQSARFMVNRWKKNGSHTDVFTGSKVFHKKGDVIIFKNKRTGLRDVMTSSYQKKIIIDWEKYIADTVRSQLPLGFITFDKVVHVMKQYYIFSPLKSISKAILSRIEAGELIEKYTKPDITDNLPKAVFDALEGVVFTNDSRISREFDKGKFYGKDPGIHLIIKGK